MRQYFFLSMICLASILLAGCDDTSVDERSDSAPVIADFSPKSGAIGTEITITGHHLNDVVKAEIGDIAADLVQKVSNQQIVIRVAGEAHSGVISLTNKMGTVKTSDIFTVSYPAPAVEASAIPSEVEMGNKLLINGNHMSVISEVLFTAVGYTTGHKADIISQNDHEIVVKIPYVEADDANITFNYFDGQKQTSTPRTALPTITVQCYKPQVTTTTFSAAKIGDIVTLQGTYLSKIEQVLVGDIECMITLQNNNELKFAVPGSESLVDGDNTLPLSIVYFGGIESKVITNEFVVKVPFIYFWENRKVYAQGRDVEELASFFSPETGLVYHNSLWRTQVDPVSYEKQAGTCSGNQKPAVSEKVYNSVNPYFFFSGVSAGNLQINSPAGSTGQLKNFYYENNSANEYRVTGSNSNCYGTAVMTYLYLNPDIDTHQALINDVKNGNIKKIDETTFHIDTEAKTCRNINIGSVSNSVNQTVYAPGIFTVGQEKSADIDSYLLVFYYNVNGLDSSNRSVNIKRIGILHLKHIDFKLYNNTKAPSSSNITFDMYWMKHDYDYNK